MSIFTHSECTVRNRTISEAVDAAHARVKEHSHEVSLCLTAVGGLSLDTPITLEELNTLKDRIYYDTLRNRNR